MSALRHLCARVRWRHPAATSVAILVWCVLSVAPAHAARFGHSRLVSAVGEPLRITIPVSQLAAGDIESLRAVPAPLSHWQGAGLTPPVPLDDLHARLDETQTAGSYVIQVWSSQVFDGAIADLLLDVHTVSGVQRYQVSILAQGGTPSVRLGSAPAPTEVSPESSADKQAAQVQQAAPSISQGKLIPVRKGDTMFGVAQRHAVPGVSVYQMMIALQRANPQAFIRGNLNLVRAGAQLVMPDRSALSAISDREARRLFHEQVVAFERFRQSLKAGELEDAAPPAILEPDPVPEPKAEEAVQTQSSAQTNLPAPSAAAGDHLRLSSPRTPSISAAPSADAEAVAAQTPATGVGLATNPRPLTQTDANPPSLAINAAAPSVAASDAAAASRHEERKDGAVNGDESSTDSSDQTSRSESASTVQSQQSGAEPTDRSQQSGAEPTDRSQQSGTEPSAASHTQTDPQEGDGAAADDYVAAQKAISDAHERISQLEENVRTLNKALQSQGEAAKDLVVDGAIGLRQSLTDVATAVTEATIGDEEPDDETTTEPDEAAVSPGVPPESVTPTSTNEAMNSVLLWAQTHLLALVSALLALLVFGITWLLRRANIAQSRSEGGITPEMVQAKLDEITLDLDESESRRNSD